MCSRQWCITNKSLKIWPHDLDDDPDFGYLDKRRDIVAYTFISPEDGWKFLVCSECIPQILLEKLARI